MIFKKILFERKSNLVIVLSVSILTLFVFLMQSNLKESSTSCSSIQLKPNINSNFDVSKFKSQNIQDFVEFGKKSDKIFKQHYETIYGNLLGPLREKEINFLEIGLGCTMKQWFKDYPPGLSLELWRRYLPIANISILEYDRVCALEFKNKVENLFIGDQSNLTFLNSIGENYGPFDFIVDDGCHTRTCQINSLVGFWPHLRSQGIFIMEDIYLNRPKAVTEEDKKKSSLDLIFQILLLFNEPTLSSYDIPIEKSARDIAISLESIHCYRRVCAFVKM